MINKTGYLLQIALTKLIQNNFEKTGWQVSHTEHSWKNTKSESDGFIDLIVKNNNKSLCAVIECKRHQDVDWIFFRDDGGSTKRRHTKAVLQIYENGECKSNSWEDLMIDPSLLETHFCIIRSDNGSDKNTLIERIASDLIDSTEAFAKECELRTNDNSKKIIYLSLIVTNAKLKIQTFDPNKISVKIGTIDDSNIEEVKYLKLRKQLRIKIPEKINDIVIDSQFSRMKENTVFIVNSEYLLDFLKLIELPEDYKINI